MAKLREAFDKTIKIWLFLSLVMCGYMVVLIIEEEVDRRYLSNIIDRTHQHPGELFIDDRVDTYVDEFVKDAKLYGFDYSRMYLYLDEIIIEKTSWEGKHGICSFYLCEYEHLHGRIRISEELYYKDKFGFKSVLYHELGHWFGKDHTYCSEELIMHYAYDSGISDSLENIWGRSIEVFFNFGEYEQSLQLCNCFEPQQPI